MATHTPTPWRYRGPANPHERAKITSDGRLELGFVGEVGQTPKVWSELLDTSPGKPTPELLNRLDEDRANAEFIVQACNVHTDLVEALEAILIYAKTMDGLSAPVAAIRDTAHIALAKARRGE